MMSQRIIRRPTLQLAPPYTTRCDSTAICHWKYTHSIAEFCARTRATLPRRRTVQVYMYLSSYNRENLSRDTGKYTSACEEDFKNIESSDKLRKQVVNYV